MSDAQTVYILCGPSGAGKSTYTKQLIALHGAENVGRCSADDFFMKDGVYNFHPSKLGQAHAESQASFRKQLFSGVKHIVVDNTNTRIWEMKPYVNTAKKVHDANLVFVMFRGHDAAELAKRNVHGVPKDVIKGMIDRVDNLVIPEDWGGLVVEMNTHGRNT